MFLQSGLFLKAAATQLLRFSIDATTIFLLYKIIPWLGLVTIIFMYFGGHILALYTKYITKTKLKPAIQN